jgi:endonuclease/exonuclease/phosphatase family metal-dependent hydrolase
LSTQEARLVTLVKIGTFNVENLFSRFNFRADVTEGDKIVSEGVTTFTFEEGAVTLRTFQGNLVKEKEPARRATVARRIKQANLDVLAVQEVEDLDTLKAFVAEDLGGLYPFVSLVEGNDDRLIDVGLLSKLPLGAVTSWRHAVHPTRPAEAVFGRDLLQVEVLDAELRGTLFTIFNTHLKSHFGGTDEENDALRKRQAEVMASIISRRLGANAPFLVVGDMNDPPDSPQLAPIRALELANGLQDPVETRPPPDDPAGNPTSRAWTHRFKPSGQPAKYELFDHIWLSPALAERQMGAVIDRRTKLLGDGSDHDLAWVVLNFSD